MKVHCRPAPCPLPAQAAERVIPLQILEMEPDSLWDGGGPTGSGHRPHIRITEMKDNLPLPFPVGQLLRQRKESEESIPRAISQPLNINRSLIESSSSTGFEPVTYKTWSSPTAQPPGKALVLVGGIKLTRTGIWPRPQEQYLLFLGGGKRWWERVSKLL